MNTYLGMKSRVNRLFQSCLISIKLSHDTWVICLTNNRYYDSDCYILELKQMLNCLPSSNILEIMIPKEELPHQQVQALDNCPVVLGSDLPTIFTFIHEHTGWKLKPLLADIINTMPITNISTCLGRDVTLVISDWCIGQKINDRRMYGWVRKHTEKYIAHLNEKVYGLHKVFHQGLRQFVIT